MADDEEHLLEVIRRKIRSGALPKVNCRMTWFGPGTTGPCFACDQPIAVTDVEIECDLPAGGTLRLHRRCYDVWVEEWQNCNDGASSGTEVR